MSIRRNPLADHYDFTRLENMWVSMIGEIIEELIATGELCDCAECVLDVSAIALNKLPTRYWVSGEFNAFTSPDSFYADPRNREQAKKAVLDAVKLVQSNPHH
ncbi:MAG TPA: late competence development ComFB family protein [Candidatus Ozemobacteraceae bacterium]|nr:late competence development ComFB family protein [Candidatus Ozemobacteraceae bacterium]